MSETAAEAEYHPGGRCRWCNKVVPDNAQALHPRYCTSRPDAQAGPVDPPSPKRDKAVAAPQPAATAAALPGMAARPLDMDPLERVQWGAAFAADKFGDDNDNLLRALKVFLDVLGGYMASLLTPDERVLFTTTCQVPNGTKTDPGLLVLSDQRVLLGWSTGVWRPVRHHDQVRLGEQLTVTKRLENLSSLRGWLSHMTVTNGRTLRFSAHDTSAGVMGNWVEGIALGAITLDPEQ